MEEFLWPRVAASLVVDGSLAVLCGLSLARFWLTSTDDAHGKPHELSGLIRRGMKLFSVLLPVTLCLQFLLLAINFCDERSFHAVANVLPDVARTRPGEVSLALCVCAAMLCVACWVRSVRDRLWPCSLLLAIGLGLRGSIGHAAIDGAFSVSELFQMLHLFSIALWSGGVLVSGLLVVPCLSRSFEGRAADSSVRRYLSRLSAVSTWAVGVVLLSGVIKSYRATEGSLHVVRVSHWGHILIVKCAVVVLTMLLGARNRWLLSVAPRWDRSALRNVVLTLRAESMCMVAVLLLSAWLANSPPPME